MKKNIAIRYVSKSGNTKKLADQIANTAGVNAETVDNPIKGYIDILFLGGSVYWGGIDKTLKSFIHTLQSDQIGEVVVFSTSALAERAYPEIKKCLTERGLKVSEKNFYCRGQFTALYRGKPDADDLKKAEVFTRNILKHNS